MPPLQLRSSPLQEEKKEREHGKIGYMLPPKPADYASGLLLTTTTSETPASSAGGTVFGRMEEEKLIQQRASSSHHTFFFLSPLLFHSYPVGHAIHKLHTLPNYRISILYRWRTVLLSLSSIIWKLGQNVFYSPGQPPVLFVSLLSAGICLHWTYPATHGGQ